MERDGAVKAGDAGGHIGAVDLLKAEHGPLQAALVLRVHLFNGKALFGVVCHSQVLGAARGQGDVHGGDDLIALRGGGFRQGVFLVGGEVTPDDLPVSVGGAGDGGAAIAGQGKLGPLQGSAPCPCLDDLQAGGFRQILGGRPLKRGLGVAGGIAGVGDNIGLLRCSGVVRQEQVVLRHTANSLNSKTALIGGGVHGDANLKGPVVFLAVGVQVGGSQLAGVHLVTGGPVLLHRFQQGAILGSEDGALGGVGGVHLGLAPVDPGGGGGGHIHDAGVIRFSVDGFFFDAVRIAFGSSRQTALMYDFHAAHILIFLGPNIHPGVEVLAPTVGETQNGFHTVKNAYLLGVGGRFRQNVPASGKGCAGDGHLTAGGPNRHLCGVFVFVLGETVDPPHIGLVQLLKLLQRSVGVAGGKGPHGLGIAVIFLHRQGLGRGYPF